MNTQYSVAESVTFMHPDKICDQISDLILDAYLAVDPLARVAVETVGGHGSIVLVGEVTAQGTIDPVSIVKQYYRSIHQSEISVVSHITNQSREIAQGVCGGGAGDQGVMIGYACRENDQFIPHELYLSRKLLRGVETDGKSQVSIEHGKVSSVVLSVQGATKSELQQRVRTAGISLSSKRIYLNNTGSFTVGGFDADAGCTGRKIVVDAYGPRVPVGGGAFSGKDPTKVDRSAAYMARWIALRLLQKEGAREVMVRLAYVIGGASPLLQTATIDGVERKIRFDCRPEAIIERFSLRRPIYLDTARNGHIGRVGELPWERDLS